MGASYGDARFAALALEAVDPDARWNTAATELITNTGAVALYDDLYRSYLQLRDATASILHALARYQQ